MSFINANTSASVWRQGGVVTTLDAHEALLRKLVEYATGKAVVGTVTRVGTGNGTISDIDTGVNAPSETWTVTFTTATAFTVAGSVSGAKAAGTTGTNYLSNGTPLTALLAFRITVGATPHIAGDTFVIPVTAGALSGQPEQWILDRWSPFTTAGGGFNTIRDQATNGTTGSLIFHGLGTGTEAIYQGISMVETPASSIWNWVHRAYQGFQGSQSWDTQTNPSPEVFTAFINSNMDYWIVVNERRIVVIAVASATMHSCYMGFFKPYASPSEWPYPNCVLAEEDAATAYNTTGANFTHGILNGAANNGHFRDIAGAWRGATASAPGTTTFGMWPTNSSAYGPASAMIDNHDILPSGDRQALPLMLFGLNSSSFSIGAPLNALVFGVLDGPKFILGRSLTPQTVLSIDGVNHLSVNDIFRLTLTDFWVMPLA